MIGRNLLREHLQGDLAAERVTPEAINFMARHGRGLICLPMTGARLACSGHIFPPATP